MNWVAEKGEMIGFTYPSGSVLAITYTNEGYNYVADVCVFNSNYVEVVCYC